MRNNSLQHIVLAQNSKVWLKVLENTFLLALNWMRGWPMLLGGCQSVEQEIKGWERTTILWLRQQTATMEGDLDYKTESLWQSDTSSKPNVLQVVAICMFLLLWASHTRVSLWRSQWEMFFQQIMKRSVIKRSSSAFVLGAGYSYLLQIHYRGGEQTVDRDWSHTLHKATTRKWWRILWPLKLKPIFSWWAGFFAQLQVFSSL